MPPYRRGSRIRNPVSGAVYELGEYLGAGAFGTVYGASPLNSPGGPEVCIKFTDDEDGWHCEAYFGKLLEGNERAIRVFESFPHVRHDRKSTPQFCLVLERARHGALAKWLEARARPWSEVRVKREVGGLLRLLDQLHGGGILHRDVTPFNVFVCDGERLKLGDFGIARSRLGGRQGVAADIFNLAWAPSGIAEEEQRRWLATDDIYQMGQLLAVLVRRDAQPITTRVVRALGCSNNLKAVIRPAIGNRGERYRDALEMLAAIQVPHQAPTGGVSSLRGKLVVFTGPLSIPREQATDWVQRMGGRVASKVTSATDVLVRGLDSSVWIAGDQGMKLLAAARLQERGKAIRIINERQFRRLIAPRW